VYHFNIFVAFYIVHIINRYIKARILIILYIDGFTDVIHTDLIPTFRLWSCKKNLWDICIIVPYKRTFVFVSWIGNTEPVISIDSPGSNVKSVTSSISSAGPSSG